MIKEKAYAKINLFLNVTDKRIDGFHDLEMIMSSLKLHDKLTFEFNDSKEIVVESDIKVSLSPKYNIVYKVAKFLQEEFQINKGVIIKITKKIPVAAGLGGGSADAAATFRGLNRLWKLNLSLDDMAKLGADFGADIPFCIYNKLCIARGKGEALVFFKQKLKAKIILINPNVEILTKDVFDMVKVEEIETRNICDMTSGISNKDYSIVVKELFNSLEKYSFELEPKIREIRNSMIDFGIDGALMCGSGGTVFGITRKKAIVQDFVNTIPKGYIKILTKLR